METLFEERRSRRFDLADDVEWNPKGRGGVASYRVSLMALDGLGFLLAVELRSGLYDDGGSDDPIGRFEFKDTVIRGCDRPVAIRRAVEAADMAALWLAGRRMGEKYLPPVESRC